jgi:hypothetical protein
LIINADNKGGKKMSKKMIFKKTVEHIIEITPPEEGKKDYLFYDTIERYAESKSGYDYLYEETLLRRIERLKRDGFVLIEDGEDGNQAKI